jgi:hypothetical protein
MFQDENAFAFQEMNLRFYLLSDPLPNGWV